jgi:prepilin-type N-terminal cleavage/methylation domain-containing protein
MLSPRPAVKSGFTLVELLVVIGIIALLIAILLPALARARLMARRTQDLSNIRQVCIACVAYATENHGDWPLGNRNGPNLTNPPSTNDDLAWINAYTFDYFLQFMCNNTVAREWLEVTAQYPNGKMIDPTIQSRFCCTSLFDSPASGVLATVGRTDYRFYIMQTTPDGAGYNETQMGFTYWGRRAQEIQGNIYDQTGTALSPAVTFTYPLKQGQKSSSNVLVSCPAYASSSYGTYLIHCFKNDSFVQGSVNQSTPGDGHSGVTAAMQGLCFAYTDGSARWVPRKTLWSMYEGGYDWMYFDKSY